MRVRGARAGRVGSAGGQKQKQGGGAHENRGTSGALEGGRRKRLILLEGRANVVIIRWIIRSIVST